MNITLKYQLIRLQSGLMGFRQPTPSLLSETYETRDEALSAAMAARREDVLYGSTGTEYVIRFAGASAEAAYQRFRRLAETELREWRHAVYGEPAPTADLLAELEACRSLQHT